MKFIVLTILTGLAVAYAATTCDRKHEKAGCFKRTPHVLPDLLINDRDPTHANYSGQLIDWNNYGDYLHSLACRCEAKARDHYNFFAIGFYGECFAGRDLTKLNHIFNTGLYYSSDCVDGKYNLCDQFSDEECSGKANVEYIYTMKMLRPKCTFAAGDGIGGKEIYIGEKESKEDCVEACWEYSKENENINGATVSPNGHKRCYCELNMKDRNYSKIWISCKFGV